jgi:Ca2+-dependent lipid-binding protein
MSKELGTLAVVVLKARNLHDRHTLYKQDPYAALTLNGKTSKTKPDVKGGQHPEWDAELRFPVYTAKNDASRMLEVTCWRAESRGDEEIGKGKVDINDTLKTGEFDGECESLPALCTSYRLSRKLTTPIFPSSHIFNI